MQFTKAQQSAIDAPAGTLLVSAGAGSGKTSVLTERIIKKICDESEPCNITDFLVVTFTKASAADLKNKISNAINKKLGESTEGTHLKRQQFLLGRANISTMDSFCKSLISANFEKLGMPAKFRIADPSEISIIKRAIFDDLLEKYHNSESEIYAAQSECSPKFSHGDFISTIENFIGAKDDENFYGVIEKLYDKVSSAIDGAALFSRELDMMRQLAALGEYAPFFGTEYGKAIRDLLLDDVAKAASELKTLNAKISAAKFEVLDKKYSPSFSNQIKFFAALSDILNEENLCRYDDAYELCAEYESVKVGSHRIDKEDTGSLEQKELLDKKNKSAKKFIGYIQTLFSHDFAETKRFAASYETALVVLGDFLDRFDAELTAEKQRQKSFEFSDLERLAFRLLVDKIDENGKIFVTELAEQLKGSYAEIYIDEYQDTNKIQDAIFRAISIENEAHENGNRFMVGDIKQSIYTFRGAKPGIFSAYSKLFEEDTDSPSKPKKIYLKTNFRSSRGIIDFINHIFSSLFSEKLGGVTYAGGEVLEFGKQEQGEAPCEKEPDVVFSLVEKIEAEDMEEAEETEKTEEAEEPDEPEENNEILVQVASAEAEYVALTIKNLLEHGRLKNGEKILPRHIVVLMRNYTKSELFMDALKKHEIPCYTDKSKGFLASAEIMLMVSLLKTIDNPMRDIELAATLKSPVFSFSLDELIYIKKFTEPMDKGVIDPARSRYKDPFYRYVCAYAAAGEMPPLKEKCESFLSKLELWRAKSRILPVDKFIWYLYRQTDMMAKISLESFAAEREANLMLLYEYARKFEETTFRGLYGFLGYLNDVQSGKDDFEKAKTTSEGGNAVRIMSVHKSKGLEFPVCILANTASPFNKSDYQRNPAIGDDGIYFDLKHSDNMGIEKPPFKKVFSERLKNEMQSEEARILYVALTRAIERLFVVGSVASLDKFLAKNTESADFSSLDSLLKWLAPILIDKEGKKKADIDFYVDLVYAGRLCELLAAADPTTASGPPPLAGEAWGAVSLPPLTGEGDRPQAVVGSPNKIKEYEKKLGHMYDFCYKKDYLSKVPAKISVSGLHPGIVAEDDYAAKTLKELKMSPLPRFMEETVTDDPALAGTAMHLFMQFADFEYAEIFGASREADNLLGRRFITEAQHARLKFYPLDKFFSSELYANIKAATRVYRETPFNLKVPVCEFLEEETEPGEEYVLIQGAIDLFFEDKEGKLHVVDFKTDQVHWPDGEKLLIERHGQQIGYYTKAVCEILSRPVEGAYIYSFSLNKAVPIFPVY